MLELNPQRRSHTDARHLFDMHILLQLADHDTLQRFDFAFVLLSKALHKHVSGGPHMIHSLTLGIEAIFLASLADVAMR